MKRVLLGLMVVVLAACSSGGQNTPAAGTTAPAGTPQTAPAGTATIKGRVLRPDGTPLAETSIRFPEVYRQNGEAMFVLDEARSPGSITDSEGNFAVVGIPAREYVMVVGDPYTNYVIILETDGTKKVFNAPADQPLDIGELKVDLKTP
ncbi:MAG TPA: hypothetical protein VGE07_27365 [Herpetosiphonaceae bacterium]